VLLRDGEIHVRPLPREIAQSIPTEDNAAGVSRSTAQNQCS
jgi:hypothetical protein